LRVRETLDRSKDFVGGLGLSERPWVGVVLVGKYHDRCLKICNAAVNATSEPTFGDQHKEPLGRLRTRHVQNKPQLRSHRRTEDTVWESLSRFDGAK
jgi:hypothetical protein